MPQQSETSTILLGYGPYGLQILRAFLSSSAARGVLQWAEVAGGAGPHERRLKDLALLYLPATAQEQDQYEAKCGRGDVALDLKRDIFGQIQLVPNGARDQKALATSMLEATSDLLAVGGQSGGRPYRPTRLDVIVLAHPQDGGDLGRLRTTMNHAMDALGNIPELRPQGQGGHRLCIIQMLDFDNYWDQVDTKALELRRALRDSLQHYEARYQRKLPSFARTYVMARHAKGRGQFKDDARQEEVVLLLQFMLFEGQRWGDLAVLFSRSRDKESPVASVGIRQLERSSAYMGRLAAARFGVGWMDYLTGTRPHGTPSPVEWTALKEEFESWSPERLGQRMRGSKAWKTAEKRLQKLAEEISSADIHDANWARQVAGLSQSKVKALQEEQSGWATRRIQEIDEQGLKELPQRVTRAVDAALHDRQHPLGVGEVIRDLELLRDKLKPAKLPEPDGVEQGDLEAYFSQVHQAHSRFSQEQVNVSGTVRLWLLLAAAVTAGATPLMSEHLSSLQLPDPTAINMMRLVKAAHWLSEPLYCGLALLALLSALGLFWVQRGVSFRVKRAQRFWTDPDKGRFANTLRGATGPGGILRKMFDRVVDVSVREAQWRLVNEVDRALELVLTRLKTRQNEITWLRQQLVSFVNESGIDERTLGTTGPLFGRFAGAVRYQTERTEDFNKMVEHLPAKEERFRDLQSEELPFKEWNEEYSPSFLFPLLFLDRLGKRFSDPYEKERADQDDGPMHQQHAEDFRMFLEHMGRVQTGFSWPHDIKVPEHRRWAVVPGRWTSHQPIHDALKENYDMNKVIEGRHPERAYMLHLDLGIRPENMVEGAK